MALPPSHSRLRTQITLLFSCSLLFFLLLGGAFFHSMSQLLLEKEESHAGDLINQMHEKISSAAESTLYYADMITNNKYTKSALTESNPAVNFSNTQILFQIVPGITENNPNVNGVMLLNLEDIFIGFNKRYYTLMEELGEPFSLFSETEYKEGFTGLLGERLENGPFYVYVKPIFQMGLGAGYPKKIGTCLILNTTAQMQSIVDQINVSPNSNFMVLDADNQLIVSNGTENPQAVAEAVMPLFRSGEDGQLTASVLGDDCLIQYKNVPQTDWTILSVIPIKEINASLYNFSLFFLLFTALIALIFFLWYYQVGHNILHPIQEIVGFMSKGANHSLSNRMTVARKNEIGVLAQQINILLDEIETLTDERIQSRSNMYEMELAKKRAELSALQSQINPHFLYNTLENLRGYGYLLESKEIVEITNSLSFIMRYCIKGSEMVTVQDELTCTQKYLNIISIRFGDRIRFHFEIDPKILATEIPRFILQPIVENAIYHGLESKSSGGELWIKGCHRGDYLFLIVEDNGVGMNEAILKSLQNALISTNSQDTIQTFGERSIGLININNRLRGLYGPEYCLTIDSAENRGTTVIAQMPWQC